MYLLLSREYCLNEEKLERLRKGGGESNLGGESAIIER
jgi:hypothetical protein